MGPSSSPVNSARLNEPSSTTKRPVQVRRIWSRWRSTRSTETEQPRVRPLLIAARDRHASALAVESGIAAEWLRRIRRAGTSRTPTWWRSVGWISLAIVIALIPQVEPDVYVLRLLTLSGLLGILVI